tara:strand:+ start:3781 stop:4671 length:891 start_codon:yes stop_codon:yes gene_type:complete
MDIVELIIDEQHESLAIDAVSLVEFPAIESEWIFLSKDTKNNLSLAKVDEHKRLIIGAALIPNKQIYRKDENGKEFYVFFSEATVKRASELYLINNNQSSATYEHTDTIHDVTTVESWIVEDTKHDKSNIYGLNLPKGSWVLSMKVENNEVWADILAKKVKGFSIEGFYIDKLATLSTKVENNKEDTDDEILTALSEILELASYKDYPSRAILNAQRAIIEDEMRGLNATKMSINIGKKLISRSYLSLTDLKKINAFLNKAKSIDTGKYSDFGTITYNLYGGTAMLNWSNKILKVQ